jgi:hypothetical protein
MADYTTKHSPNPRWTPNLNALIEFMPAGFQAQAASSELTKLKALAALALDVANELDARVDGYAKELREQDRLPDMEDTGWMNGMRDAADSLRQRYNAITKDGGK